ncbi:unnamed protein product [Absidia cylindrospora]
MTATALSFNISDIDNFDYDANAYRHPLSPDDCNFLTSSSPPLSWDSNMCHDDTNGSSSSGRSSGNSGKRSQKRGVSTFITKLYGMIGDQKYQQLITWNPSGASFLVCNATRFSEEVLPVYFKHSNFSSFVRQLNMYGFHKINKSLRGQRGFNENEIWEFSHSKFLYGRPELLEGIKRKAMDSEMLRRETGDIHASFNMVQLTQSDLLQQFNILQDHYSTLIQNFEELKKTQLQQQIILRRLAESSSSSGKTQLQNPDVLITEPQWQQQQQQQTDIVPVMYPQECTPMSTASNLNVFPPSPALSDPSSQSHGGSYSNDSPCHSRPSSYAVNFSFS